MTIRVCLGGATGWIGKPLSYEINRSEDMILSGAVSRKNAGRKLGEILGSSEIDLKICGTVEEALSDADVYVDFTHPTAAKANVLTAIQRQIAVVIGTSGLTDFDYEEIDRAARAAQVGVIAAGNFSITAVLLERFACEAAKYLSHWEILDYASSTKIDAPSGVVRELAFRLSEVRQPDMAHPINRTIGEERSRGATLNGSHVHSLRLPGYTIGVEIIFGEDHERLTIRHDADSDPAPYLQGTLTAIRKARNFIGLKRGLDSV
ncbi:MAG TPA: 4-hydroxy-tetrahydrodipicolinate reductase, partial [Acidobacteriota bacterium]|nr:4-hydroxy-tetrahydrodipicolinate reductase [Acidobacteriota bacterium]